MSQAGSNSLSSVITNIAFIEDVGIANISGGILNVVGGPGIQTVGSGNTITINSIGGGFNWQSVDSSFNPISLVPQNGYFANGPGAVVFILPVTAAAGDTFIIVGGGNLWSVTQNANQSMVIGIDTTTVGVGGSVTATTYSDTLTLVCMQDNFVFKAINWAGNPTII